MSAIRHPRCRHPAILRRAIAGLSVLGSGFANAINEAGVLLQKVGNTLRFEHFWDRYVSGNPDVVILPSFTRSRTKRPIWDIALTKAQELGTTGQVLEFGTNNGGSLMYFWRHLPSTMHLVGFDCFEGIPESWDSLPKGAIKGYGAPVELWADDPVMKSKVIEQAARGEGFPPPPQRNITIEKGLFSATVPRYLRDGVPPDIRLIHFDADIYMGTRPVLDSIAGQITYSYFILFDELYSVNHEFRAWMEFVDLFSVESWRVVAISEDGVQALIHVNP